MVVVTAIFAGIGMTAAKATSVNDGQIILPVIVNGHKVKFPDAEPYVDENGRTMVPVRFVSEMLGGGVNWNNATYTVTIKTDDKNISLTIGSKTPTVNGHAVELDTAAAMVEGRTMVPLRFVSEVLGSKVTWDQGANAVQITDAAYQEKIDNGSVKLDAWGRELGMSDDKWNKLADMPSFVYDLKSYASTSNKDFANKFSWVDKKHIDMWATNIRKYYQVQLNIDYRTFDEETFISNAMKYVIGDNYSRNQFEDGLRIYAAWVKKNHIITKGYADPENSLVTYRSSGPVMLTHFKFMIVKADDTAQTFADNTQVSEWSDSFKLKTGVWYDGYSDVVLGSIYARQREDHYGIIVGESMFSKGHYKYEVLSSDN